MCIWCEHVKNTSPCLPPCHLSLPFSSLLSSFWSCNEKKKREKLTDKMQEMFCCFPRHSVWQKVCFFYRSEQNLWKLSLDFTPRMMEWINLPGRDHVLTTGSVLSQRDLYNTSREGFPIAWANYEARYTLRIHVIFIHRETHNNPCTQICGHVTLTVHKPNLLRHVLKVSPYPYCSSNMQYLIYENAI